MTDTSSSDNGTDDISAEELESSKSIDLRALGIDPMVTPVGDLLKLYRESVNTVKEYTRKQAEGTQDPNSVDSVVKNNVNRVLKREGTSDEVNARIDKVRSFIGESANRVFSAEYDLISSAIALDELKSLVSDMQDEYDYHFNAAVQLEKDAKGIKSTPSETAITAKLTSVALSNLVKARIAMATALGEDIGVDNLYRTEGTRKGFNADVFPRLPKLDVEGNVQTNSTHLVFRWQETGSDQTEDLTETTLNDVAHNVVSKGTYRITGKQIASDLKKAGKGIGATTEVWELTYKTGTLYGKKA